MLRVYQSWYHQLIDLKNELRGEVGDLLYSDGSVAQTDMILSYMCILPAVMYDIFDYTSPESPLQYFDYCRNMVRIFCHDIDTYFVLSKKVLSWVRNTGSIGDLFSLAQSDDRVIDMVEVPGDILASRHTVPGMRAYNALFFLPSEDYAGEGCLGGGGLDRLPCQ